MTDTGSHRSVAGLLAHLRSVREWTSLHDLRKTFWKVAGDSLLRAVRELIRLGTAECRGGGDSGEQFQVRAVPADAPTRSPR